MECLFLTGVMNKKYFMILREIIILEKKSLHRIYV